MIYDDNNQGELFNNSMCAAGPHSSLNGEHMEEWKVENKIFGSHRRSWTKESTEIYQTL